MSAVGVIGINLIKSEKTVRKFGKEFKVPQVSISTSSKRFPSGKQFIVTGVKDEKTKEAIE